MKNLIGVCTIAVLLSLTARRAMADCIGDCNSNDEVTVNELILGVNIALGAAQLAQCAAFDANADGEVAVNELIGGVNSVLTGCPAAAPGDYTASVDIDGQPATIDFTVAPSGQINGTVTLAAPPPSLRPLAVSESTVSITGTANLVTGAFLITGTYTGPGGPLDIRVEGTLPSAVNPGAISIRIGSTVYTASFSTPTRTPTPTPTISAAAHTVLIGQGSLPFDPELLEIDAGETVTWSWGGGTHSVQSHASGSPTFPNCAPDGRFDSGVRSSGTFSVTFTTPGTYEYHCGVSGHCQNFESGMVIVRGPATPTPTPTVTIPPTFTTTPTPQTIGGVATEMLGIYSGRVINHSFPGEFTARIQIGADLDHAYIVDLDGSLIGFQNSLTMVPATPTRLTFDGGTPFDGRSLTLELTGPGHVTGEFIVRSMGVPITLSVDLTKQ